MNSVCIWGIPSIILLEIGNPFLLKYAPELRIYLTINVNCLLTMIHFTFDADNNIILIPHKTTVLARGRIADLARHDGAHWQNYSAPTTTRLYCSVQPAWPGQQHLANDDDDSMPSSAVGMLRSHFLESITTQ